MVTGEDRLESATTGARRLVSVLRLVAVALVVVGFVGWLVDHDGEVVLESPYTLAFGVGVACALVAIYLGVFLANRG
ncbi:hypothetical protein B1756_08800 [Natrarchaeobaculum aegyptiacum]|uniref:Uncharacterized protein n=1 Tax=Natrarchaeobaculum aegyptiacum TaxID=745377 RepID=A0A2Z2HW91_9EURY|nr:hypothetical protein B1756_08800 [Natrarchaeobaculum aegyptiacum]